jgi:hypothetical protein
MALCPVRRELLRLLISVLVVDAVGSAVYRLTKLHAAGPDARLTYTVLWMLATLAVVVPSLVRMRRLREGGRGRDAR